MSEMKGHDVYAITAEVMSDLGAQAAYFGGARGLARARSRTGVALPPGYTQPAADPPTWHLPRSAERTRPTWAI